MPDAANLDSRIDLLLELVESITASPDLDQVLGRVVRSATGLVEGSRSTLWILEDQRLVARARAGARNYSTATGRTEFPIGEGIVGHTALERRTVLVPDVQRDPRTVDREYFAAEGLAACAAIPLISHGRLVGVLALVTSRAEDIGPSVLEMLTAFGGHAAMAIESARLYADAERRRSEAETLANVARDLAEHHDLDTVLVRIVEGANALCGGDVTSVALRDGEGLFSARYVVGARHDTYRRFRIEPGLGIGGRAVLSLQAARATERQEWPAMPREYAEVIDSEGLQSALAVPIIVGGEAEGLLYVCSRSPRSFSEADETVLVRLAHHAATALQNSRLFAAEQAARTEAEASERNFRELVDSVDAIVLDADAETSQVLFVNARAETILGYPRSEWYDDPAFWANHVHPADRDLAAAQCQEATAAGLDHVMEYRMLAADGRVLWMRDMVRVQDSPFGGRRQLRSVMVDITERKHADALLTGEREILRLIAVGAPLGGVLTGICQIIESMRPELLASVVLIHAGRMKHGAAPSLPQAYVETIDGIAIGPCTGSCGTAAYRKETVIVSDIATDPLWAGYSTLALSHGLRACWSAPVVDGAGEVMATFALYRRVPGTPSAAEVELVARAAHLIRIAIERDRATVALQRSEERYRALVTHIPAVTWLADAGSNTIFVSPNAAQVTGFAAEELTAGGKAAWFARVHPDDAAAVRQAYAALEFERQPFDLEYRLRHRNGAWIWIHDCAISSFERDGVAYFAGVLTNVTARKEAELEVQEQRQLLTHLTRVATLGELSGALAHELNQPLTSILTNAQAALRFLTREPPDLAELREILHDIVDDDQRAGEVIRRLRALLRKGETPRQPLDVNDLVGDVLRLAHSELIGHGVTVTLQLTPGLPKVAGDRVALQQVLLNLIVNACDAMRLDQPVDRQLTIDTTLDDEDVVRLAVADRGAGIPVDGIERIFEPFFTTKEHGLGLGLMICRSIVAAHGGRLWATNNPDRGATFAFTLPVEGDAFA
jgi:PAS domain S-box-containing protein